MRCLVCDHEQWENVDEFREKPHGMSICTHCGFVSYPEKYKTEEEIKAYYSKDYRKPPTFNNAITGQKKVHMHAYFLDEIFRKWKDNEQESPVVCDVGAAYGLFLNYVRGIFQDADINGTEYALAYRRNAWHEFQIPLTVDFDKSKKYDLISSFKVAEHQMDADKRLREYVECLKDDGYMYVSVPTWFNRMTNFGADGFNIEYYYHPDHINVWTQTLFETVLKKVGLKVIKFDGDMYDETYLCKRDDSLMKEDPVYEDPAKIKQKLQSIKTAVDMMKARDFKGAVEAFPNFPTGWRAYYEANRADPHNQSKEHHFDYILKNFVEPCLKSCDNGIHALQMATDICMRYEQYEMAVQYIEQANLLRPNNSSFIMALSQCYRQMAMRSQDQGQAMALLTEARNAAKYCTEIDIGARSEATTWAYQDNANMPTPQEAQT